MKREAGVGVKGERWLEPSTLVLPNGAQNTLYGSRRPGDSRVQPARVCSMQHAPGEAEGMLADALWAHYGPRGVIRASRLRVRVQSSSLQYSQIHIDSLTARHYPGILPLLRSPAASPSTSISGTAPDHAYHPLQRASK